LPELTYQTIAPLYILWELPSEGIETDI